MDPTTLKIAELEEKARQLTSEIVTKKEELNKVQIELYSLRPKISKDALVAKAEPDGIYPGPRFLNPLEVFPELVWLNISYKIKSTQDWLNLYSASSNLMDLLEKDKLERTFYTIFPNVSKYLRRGDVINLCEANGNFASNIVSWAKRQCSDPRWADVGWEGIYDDSYTATFPVYHVNRLEIIQQITAELAENSDFWIPFGFIFRDEHWEEMEYWESVKAFLEMFGTRIWLCKLIFSSQNPNHREFPEIIIQCLRLIPNVIRLGLDITREDIGIPNPILVDDPQIFPRLPNLKVLSRVSITRENFVDFLRVHADQLTSLTIQGKYGPEEYFRWSNLKKLDLSRRNLSLDSFAQAPLTQLFRKINARNFARFGRKFLELNAFGGTLESLELNVKIDDEEENDMAIMAWIFNIRLPKLKKLAISDYRGGLGFLLGIPSLQCLDLDDVQYGNHGGILLDGTTRNGIYNSTIWSVLLNLREIEIYHRWGSRPSTYTRKEYIQYHEDQLNRH